MALPHGAIECGRKSVGRMSATDVSVLFQHSVEAVRLFVELQIQSLCVLRIYCVKSYLFAAIATVRGKQFGWMLEWQVIRSISYEPNKVYSKKKLNDSSIESAGFIIILSTYQLIMKNRFVYD